MAEKKNKETSFFSSHAAIIFIVALMGIGVCLLPVGRYLRSLDKWAYLCACGEVISQIAGCFVAVALTALFLNLPDIRRYLATVMATLFSEGEVVPALSSSTKTRLSNRLLLDAIKNRATSFEPTLYNHLRNVSECSLSVPYLTNYHLTSTIHRDQNEPRLIVDNDVTTYRIHVHHLKPEHRTFPLHVFRETVIPHGLETDRGDWLRDFGVQVGTQEFTRDDVQFNEKVLERGRLVHAKFSHEITLDADADVSVKIVMVDPHRDPVTMAMARYPAQGFRVTVTFEEDYIYDYGWFVHCPVEQDVPEKGQVIYLPNGLEAYTHDWVLPGEGVTVYYFPLQSENGSGCT